MISDFGKDGFYESKGVRLYHSHFNLNWFRELGIYPKTIIDIGSYDCGDAIRYKQEYPDSVVYSFEACRQRMEIINRYIDNFNVFCFPYAITNFIGKALFYPSKDYYVNEETTGSQGSLYQHTEKYRQSCNYIKQLDAVRVHCETLKNVCKKYSIKNIDLLHIDAEGSELQILQGLDKSILPKLIYSEIEDGLWERVNQELEIYEWFSDNDYQLVIGSEHNKLYLKNNLCLEK